MFSIHSFIYYITFLLLLLKVPQCIEQHEPILSPMYPQMHFLSQMKESFQKSNPTSVDSYTYTCHHNLFCNTINTNKYKRNTTIFKYDQARLCQNLVSTSPCKGFQIDHKMPCDHLLTTNNKKMINFAPNVSNT